MDDVMARRRQRQRCSTRRILRKICWEQLQSIRSSLPPRRQAELRTFGYSYLEQQQRMVKLISKIAQD